VFQFSELPLKLHEFVKLASWEQPIALIPSASINSINGLCSVASYYGVNLEIVRVSEESQSQEEATGSKLEERTALEGRLIDYTVGAGLADSA
jgi:hypothetical protein